MHFTLGVEQEGAVWVKGAGCNTQAVCLGKTCAAAVSASLLATKKFEPGCGFTAKEMRQAPQLQSFDPATACGAMFFALGTHVRRGACESISSSCGSGSACIASSWSAQIAFAAGHLGDGSSGLGGSRLGGGGLQLQGHACATQSWIVK